MIPLGKGTRNPLRIGSRNGVQHPCKGVVLCEKTPYVGIPYWLSDSLKSLWLGVEFRVWARKSERPECGPGFASWSSFSLSP